MRSPYDRCKPTLRRPGVAYGDQDAGTGHRRGRLHRIAGRRPARRRGARGGGARRAAAPGARRALPDWSRRHDLVVGDVRDAAGAGPAPGRRGRGLPPGGDGRARAGPVRRARVRRPQRLRHRCAARRDAPGRGAAAGAGQLDGRLRRGALRLPGTARSARPRGAPTTWRPAGTTRRARVCGGTLGSALVPEDAPLEPRSTYAASKLAQEHLAAAWARQTGGGVWALRYHNVYGPRMPRDTPYAGVAVAVPLGARPRGRPPQVLEDGRQRRDFVHVTDVARANLLALAAPPPAALVAGQRLLRGAAHGRRAGRGAGRGDGRPGADGRRRRPAGRRAARGRPSAAGDGTARLHRAGRVHRRGSRLRHRPAAGAGGTTPDPRDRADGRRSRLPRVEPGHRPEQVVDREGGGRLPGQPPRRVAGRQVRGRRPAARRTNGSQIRSTSALLSPDRSATRRPRAAARSRQQDGRPGGAGATGGAPTGVRPARSRRRRHARRTGAEHRPGAETSDTARLAHTQ